MNGKHLFLTSAGLTDKMKEKFFDIIGKCPKDVKVLYIPTAGIETDGARESLAICFHELFLMGIQYENILVYNLELILSKDYQRTYSSYVTTPFMPRAAKVSPGEIPARQTLHRSAVSAFR